MDNGQWTVELVRQLAHDVDGTGCSARRADRKG
jgi:hypothetical protein